MQGPLAPAEVQGQSPWPAEPGGEAPHRGLIHGAAATGSQWRRVECMAGLRGCAVHVAHGHHLRAAGVRAGAGVSLGRLVRP
ncbi:protein of unknown function [Rhodovastum atsumiense]|nr:protein of unknown function [Rhodovastum atsumiense]